MMHSFAKVALALCAAAGCTHHQPSADATDPTEASEQAGAPVHVDAAGAAELLASDPHVVVLDVRTPSEFADGHVAGAVNIDYRADDFAARLAELDRGKTYLVLCRSGRRSTDALAPLQQLGFEHIYHLDGGILAWTEAGQPLTK
jgi:rhodanese-related sulfurtransferase